MKIHLCILFCLALLGCQQQKKKKPSDLIPESKMVSLLADIHMAESQVESSISYPDTALMVFSNLQKTIWEKYDVTGEEFRKTYNFYATNIDEMDKLYEIVVDTLIAREASFVIKGSNTPEILPDTANPVTDTVIFDKDRKRLKAAPGGFKYDTETGN